MATNEANDRESNELAEQETETSREHTTEPELTSFRIRTEPAEGGEIQVSGKGEGAVTLAITDGSCQLFGQGTAAYAFMDARQTLELIEDLNEAYAEVTGEGRPAAEILDEWKDE